MKRRLAACLLSISIVWSAGGTVFAAASETVYTQSIGDSIIHSGLQYIGTPYLYGADPSQTSTFDCSSFTYRAFINNGINLPRTTNQQYALGSSVSLANAVPGDLVFYRDSENPAIPGHVGIYMGNMKMLHASTSKGVITTDITTSYWTSRFLGVKRVIPKTVTVVSGDTLWKISMAQHVTIQQLQSWNRLTSDGLVPGQNLMIQNPDLMAGSTNTSAKTYFVQPGDTLWLIYGKTGVTIDQLKAWNRLTGDGIYVGQLLLLEAPFQTYTVVSGDTLWIISNKYKVSIDSIKKANQLTSDSIYVGQTLRIPSY